LRILTAGYGAAWVSTPQALYRKHGEQMSRKLVTMSRNLLEVYEGLSLDAMPTAAHRQLLTDRRRRGARETRLPAAFGWLAQQPVEPVLDQLWHPAHRGCHDRPSDGHVLENRQRPALRERGDHRDIERRDQFGHVLAKSEQPHLVADVELVDQPLEPLTV